MDTEGSKCQNNNGSELGPTQEKGLDRSAQQGQSGSRRVNSSNDDDQDSEQEHKWMNFSKQGLIYHGVEGVNLLRAMELMDGKDKDGDKKDNLQGDNIVGVTEGEELQMEQM
jgi:hypothetical protein